jgi:hypothetical protein
MQKGTRLISDLSMGSWALAVQLAIVEIGEGINEKMIDDYTTSLFVNQCFEES